MTMLPKVLRKFIGTGAVLVLGLVFLVGCGGTAGQSTGTSSESAAAESVATAAPAPTEAAAEPTATPVEAVAEPAESELARVESVDGPPFYARFGEGETFGDNEWVAVVFYRSPDCIPDDFNMNAFFHFPSDFGPGAFGCQPPTTDVVEYWAGAPGSGPAPKVSEMTGRGAVPVWFFSRADITAANADGEVTIGELENLASRRVGSATVFTELLHPSQSNTQPLIQFRAEGALEDGGDFLVDVSYGDPAVTDHTTIEIE
jgi:hypothetical protein